MRPDLMKDHCRVVAQEVAHQLVGRNEYIALLHLGHVAEEFFFLFGFYGVAFGLKGIDLFPVPGTHLVVHFDTESLAGAYAADQIIRLYSYGALGENGFVNGRADLVRMLALHRLHHGERSPYTVNAERIGACSPALSHSFYSVSHSNLLI